MELDRYRPQTAWFAHNAYGIHGLNHVARVLVWADRLANWLVADGEVVDIEVVRWAAALHDLGRHNDRRDPEHGDRSAEWLAANHRQLGASLTEQQMESIDYVCRWHVPGDGMAPTMTNELRCLKDADGLDRVRIADLDPRQLRIPLAMDLVEAAWDLFNASWPIDDHDPWRQVRTKALVRGLWH
ncbi:MAG: HD domain-containing protein [Chloroflexota bacterium]